jgi:hypothetical protein
MSPPPRSMPQPSPFGGGSHRLDYILGLNSVVGLGLVSGGYLPRDSFEMYAVLC